MRLAKLVDIVVVVTLLTPMHGSSRTSEDVNKEQTDALVRSFGQFSAAFVIAYEMKLDKACADYKGTPSISVDDFVNLLDAPSERERLKLRTDFDAALLKATEAKNPKGKRMSEEVYLVNKEYIQKLLGLTASAADERVCDALAKLAINLLAKSKEFMKTAKNLEKEMDQLKAKGK